MTRFLKIPNLCYAKAKQRGLLNDVVFYYQLKRLSDNGFFIKGTISSLHEELPYEQPTIWKKLRRLVDVDLIRKYSNGYQLVNYNKLFSLLGYDLAYANKRYGTFKIHKIPLSECNNIKDLLAWIDIRENLNKQVHKAFNSFKKSNQYTAKNLSCTTMDDKRKFLSDIVKRSFVQMIESNDKHKEHCEMIEVFDIDDTTRHCNPDITLSLKGICSILELPNCSSAHLIVQRLSEQNRVSISTRKVFIETTTLSYNEIKEKYGDSYTLKDGMVFRTLTNLIKCINN